jgi:ABC-type multidrug transport system ATPase subunit
MTTTSEVPLAIEAHGLVKAFGSIRAVDGLDLAVPGGGVFSLLGLVTQGTAVLLTTQYLDEADQLSDRIAVIDHGRTVAEGTPGELKASVGSGVLRVQLAEASDCEHARQVLGGVLGIPAERALMNGTPAAGEVGWVLLTSAVLTAVFAPLTMRLYRAGRG